MRAPWSISSDIVVNLLSMQLTSSSALSWTSFYDATATPANGVIVLPSQPVITSILMTNGKAGTPITLSGINFGTYGGFITFNGVSAPIIIQIPNGVTQTTNWTTSSVTVPIPSGAVSGLVFVTTSFTLITIAPTVVTTSSGPVSNGVPITLTEAGVCSVQ
jgi:hypothetical protein